MDGILTGITPGYCLHCGSQGGVHTATCPSRFNRSAQLLEELKIQREINCRLLEEMLKLRLELERIKASVPLENG